MKKIIASAGLVTLGATGLQAAYAPGLSPMETAKPWSIAATLRGFYDDNYNYAPAHPVTPGTPKAHSSPGFELSPSFKLNLPMEQTYLGVGYLYSLKYFADRKGNDADHMHELTLKADHQFTERYKGSFDDSFIYTTEPVVADSTSAVTTYSRHDVIHNRARIDFQGQITELLGTEISYQNNWYDYLKNDDLSAILDRFEHLFDLKGTWQVQPHLIAFAGYEYGIYDYTSDRITAINPATLQPITGKDRNNTSHYFYVGGEHAFSSQLNGTLKIGAQYTSYDYQNQSSWNPYVDVRGTYTYLPGSFVQLGITHTRNATDLVNPDANGSITLDQESTTIFGSITHRITSQLSASVNGQYQHSTFKGGRVDGDVDNFFLASIDLEYRINQYWVTEVGYNFDRLSTDVIDRGFTRNRVYAGARVNF